MKVLVTQSNPMDCDSMDCSPPGLQAPLSMEFSRQEYWWGMPFPSPGDLPDPGIEPGSPVLQADSLPSVPPVNPLELPLISVKLKKEPLDVSYRVWKMEWQSYLFLRVVWELHENCMLLYCLTQVFDVNTYWEDSLSSSPPHCFSACFLIVIS